MIVLLSQTKLPDSSNPLSDILGAVQVVNSNRHLTKAKMEVMLRHYLDRYYPEERIHTSLGMSPKQYEQWLSENNVT